MWTHWKKSSCTCHYIGTAARMTAISSEQWLLVCIIHEYIKSHASMLDPNIWQLFIHIRNASVLFALYCVLQTMTEMAIELRKVFFLSKSDIFGLCWIILWKIQFSRLQFYSRIDTQNECQHETLMLWFESNIIFTINLPWAIVVHISEERISCAISKSFCLHNEYVTFWMVLNN